MSNTKWAVQQWLCRISGYSYGSHLTFFSRSETCIFVVFFMVFQNDFSLWTHGVIEKKTQFLSIFPETKYPDRESWTRRAISTAPQRTTRRSKTSKGWINSTKSSTLTKAQLAARRVRIRQHTPACSHRFANSSRRCRKRASAATSPDVFHST